MPSKTKIPTTAQTTPSRPNNPPTSAGKAINLSPPDCLLVTALLTKAWFHLRLPSTAVLSTHGTQIACHFPATRHSDHCGSGGPSYRVVPSLTTHISQPYTVGVAAALPNLQLLIWADRAAKWRARFARGLSSVETHALFFIAAIVAGAINALAGGSGLITFPLLALVVPPVTADATSALAPAVRYPRW
jgi:hypothetical protein